MKTITLAILFLALLIPVNTYGQDDIYRVKTPNVMIIFDTSNSMDQKPDGTSQGSGAARVNAEGRVVTAPAGTVYNFEEKGNHPNSKLYQAKLALKEILETVVKDRVNLGFSTYAQSKSPDHMWGYYWRQYRYYYPKPIPPGIGRNFTGGFTRTGIAGTPPSSQRTALRTSGGQRMWESKSVTHSAVSIQ